MKDLAIGTVARVALRHVVGLTVAIAVGASAHAQSLQATGGSTASLALAFEAEVPAVFQLGLDAGVLSFDLPAGRLDKDGLPCRVSDVADDPFASPNVADERVFPAGTTFRPTTWPSIEVTGGRALESFPPSPDAGRIICYRSFLARPFASVASWSLTATRSDLADTPPLEALYVGGGCRGYEAPGVALLSGQNDVRLATSVPDAPRACDTVRVIVAVDVTAQATTSAATTVRYTLVSSDAEFDQE